MKYLLDTDTLIDFIQDRGNTRTRIAAMTEAGDLIGLCAITVAELQSGVSQNNYRLFRLATVGNLKTDLVPSDEQVAQTLLHSGLVEMTVKMD